VLKRDFLTGDIVMKKGILLTATVLGSLFVSAQALAGASANIGLTSNYLWRGVSQSDGHPAIQGGLDYAADNGLYVGTWASNEKFGTKGTELDIYGGYKKELKGGLSYDLGAVKYNYPNHNSTEFSEAYAKLGFKGIGAEADYTFQSNASDPDPVPAKGDMYYALGYTGELKHGWGYGAKVGRYNFKNSPGGVSPDYNHVQLSLTKDVGKVGKFTLAADKPSKPLNNDKSDARVSLAWTKSFDF
jgi:uncharacterized protein (TIGR02001 family)